ncbi:MAG: ABC transporter ATP-binding protein [Alphaproteobacteria bacterium]|nr:ABC transporter ATP-binding protein [Alphaproteobacteria bacterium]
MRRGRAAWAELAAQPFIRVVGVSKSFGSYAAIDNVSLDIYRGEFFALLGPSGCGKTTLLRMLAGLEFPTAGRIEIDGSDMTRVPPYERPVNMMFQSYALFPHMSVEQNVAFGLKQEGCPRSEIARRVREMLALVQLEPFAKRRPHQLSGGQRQRVALARCLVKRPKMVLLDEPLAALDKKLREKTQFELINIQEQVGITFVIVTHDQAEAMTVASRIGVMERGRIVQVATPAEIYEAPASRYVAEFIGDVNLFEGRLLDTANGTARIRCDDAACDFLVEQTVNAEPGATVWLALRPEKLAIDLASPEAGAVNQLSGTVLDIGYLGSLSVYHVQLATGKQVTAVETNRARLVRRPISWNDQVHLTASPEAAVVLLR